MRRGPLLILRILSLAASLLCAAGAALALYVVRDPRYHCLVDVPAPAGGPFAPAGPEAEWHWLPLGAACRFTTEDGAQSVLVPPTWTTTALIAASVVLLLVAVLASIPRTAPAERSTT
jgi:hypothetical protein